MIFFYVEHAPGVIWLIIFFYHIKSYSFTNVENTAFQHSFQNQFLYLVGDELNTQNLQFWISQKWLEISTPNFYQLSTSMKTRFVQKIKVIGAQNLDFPPKM